MTTALEPEVSTYRWSSHDEADRFPVEGPATGEVITLVQGGGTAEVNAAVEAAHRAFQADWRWRTPAERAALLLKAADVLAEHADELALLESRENGKPVADARSNDINFLIGVFRFFGSLVDKLPTDFYDKGAIYTSPTSSPSAWSARSSRSTGRRSTPAARWHPPSRPATPSSSSRASRHRSP